MENMEDLKSYFHIERLDEAVNDTFEDAEALQELVLEVPYTEHLDELFKPLDITDTRTRELSREKARNWNRGRHASWLRIYAIRQYVSKLLSGTENLSFKSVANIEDKLGISCFAMA